jgi:uncharacterized membrane protein YqjE
MSLLEETSSLLPGLGRLQSSAATILRGADHRAELASLELGEARDKALGLSVLFLIGAVATLLTGFALNLFVAALWWDTPHRLLAIGLLAGVQAAGAIGAIAVCVSRARQWNPLSETFDQLKKDTQCLHELLKNSQRQ